MSLLKYLFKPRKDTAKPNTKPVRVGKYIISAHAQNRISQKKRNLSKWDLLINLYGNSYNSDLYVKDGVVQYDRVNSNNRTTTHIIDKNNKVKTIRKYHNTEKGRQEAYKNFKGGEPKCVSRKKKKRKK